MQSKNKIGAWAHMRHPPPLHPNAFLFCTRVQILHMNTASMKDILDTQGLNTNLNSLLVTRQITFFSPGGPDGGRN